MSELELEIGLLVTVTLTPGVKVRKEIGGEDLVLEVELVLVTVVVLEIVLTLVMVLVLVELGGTAKVLGGPDL